MSLNDAFCADEKYTRASWINVTNITFHELTGINVILLYSNTILETILGDSDSGFNARTGTYMISAINTLSSFLCIFTVRTFGRRPLLLWGHTGIFFTHFMIGVFTITKVNYGVLVMICLFMFIY